MTLDLIAQYYDLLYADFEDDLPMWSTLAAETGGPILEVGCGTGRVLLPLAQEGYEITGLDLSEVALDAVQAKVQAVGVAEHVTTHQADMRAFDIPNKKFRLAYIALNSYMHCHTPEDQLGTLRTIHRHMEPRGKLVIDLVHTDPTLLAEADGRLYFEDELVDTLTGRTVQYYWRHEIDLAEQMRHLVYILDEIGEDGLVRRVQIPLSLRYFYRFEMELLLRARGFILDTIYGDYDQSPFQSHSPRMIFVATKK